MSRRPNCTALLTCECSADERAILDQMKTLAAVTSDANLARIALWSLADHYDLPMPPGCFDLRLGQGRYQRNPKITQT